MDKYLEKSRDYFEAGDCILSLVAEPSYNDLTKNKKLPYLAMQALACEYYLKGILLPLIDIVYATTDDMSLKPIIDSLTEDDIYNLKIGNRAEIFNDISSEYGISKKRLNFIKSNDISSNSHDLSAIFKQIFNNYNRLKSEVETEIVNLLENDALDNERKTKELSNILDKYKKIKALPEIKEQFTYSVIASLGIRTHYDDTVKSSPKYQKMITDLKATDDDDNLFFKILDIIEDLKINNAFSEGRYGFLKEDFDLDSTFIYHIMHDLKNLTLKYDDALPLNLINNNNFEIIKRIYPDPDTYLYIIGVSVERVYTYTNLDSNNHTDISAKYTLLKAEKKYGEILHHDFSDRVMSTLSSWHESNFVAIPRYGINSMLKILEKRDPIRAKFPTPIDLIIGDGDHLRAVFSNNILPMNDDEIIAYFQNGEIKLCWVLDKDIEEIDKNKYPDTYLECIKICGQFEDNCNDSSLYKRDQNKLTDFFSKFTFNSSNKIISKRYSYSFSKNDVDRKISEERKKLIYTALIKILKQDPIIYRKEPEEKSILPYMRRLYHLKNDRRKLIQEFKKIYKNNTLDEKKLGGKK